MFTVRMEDHRPALIDNGVHVDDQVMPLNRSFWAFFTVNLVLPFWVVGILVITLGMDFWSGLLVIVIGNAVGAGLTAVLATMGPKTRLSQMESSRASFGKAGTRIPSFLNWITCIGWDVVNNVPSAAAFVGFFAMLGAHLPFWLCLSFLALVQVVIGFYGHHMVQWIEKSLGFALLITFAVVGIVAITKMGSIPVDKPFSFKSFLLTLGIVISCVVAYSAYASDYTRYLPSETPTKSVFWRVFLGLFLSSGLLEGFGSVTAGAVVQATPQGLMDAITANTGVFAPIALLLVAISCIPQNAMNDNSGAYSLISAGVRIPRHLSAVIAGVIAFILALWGSGQFVSLLENFLLLLLYWLFPWIAIVLVDWFMGEKSSFKFSHGWSVGATIWAVVTILTMALFPATDLYTGPIAKLLGGVDLGYYVGFGAAGLLYWLVIKNKTKSDP